MLSLQAQLMFCVFAQLMPSNQRRMTLRSGTGVDLYEGYHRCSWTTYIQCLDWSVNDGIAGMPNFLPLHRHAVW